MPPRVRISLPTSVVASPGQSCTSRMRLGMVWFCSNAPWITSTRPILARKIDIWTCPDLVASVTPLEQGADPGTQQGPSRDPAETQQAHTQQAHALRVHASPAPSGASGGGCMPPWWWLRLTRGTAQDLGQIVWDFQLAISRLVLRP